MARDGASLDAVLPLALRDLDRAHILLRSLRLVEPLGTLWIVVPDRERHEIERALPATPGHVVPESELLPDLELHRRLFGWLHRGLRVGSPVSGWEVQQLIKLAAASVVGTPFYLTLDADVICLKRMRFEDLVRGGRAVHQRHGRDLHADWYRRAERILRVRRSGWTHGVTPAVLSRDAARALQHALASRVNPLLRALAACLPAGPQARAGWASWSGHLLRSRPFTEYSLYATYLEASGLYHRFHVPVPEDAIYANCVWSAEDFEGWDPARLADFPDAWFCVVQSNTGVPARLVEARLARAPSCA